MFARPSAPGEANPSIRPDRQAFITGSILVVVAALAWVGVILQAMTMPTASVAESMAGTDMPSFPSLLAIGNAIGYLVAWEVMMAAMMLPSATPMIALYDAVRRNATRAGGQVIPTIGFILTYMVVWLIVGIPAYTTHVLQSTLVAADPAVAELLPYAVAVSLTAAGAYQFSPLKRVCLRVCRSPLAFLLGHWRPGYRGTLQLGLEHAAHCVGCCWGLMLVLVVAGAMGLHWVLLIAALVFAEKILPHGELTARISGAALVVLGVAVAVQPALSSVLRASPM